MNINIFDNFIIVIGIILYLGVLFFIKKHTKIYKWLFYLLYIVGMISLVIVTADNSLKLMAILIYLLQLSILAIVLLVLTIIFLHKINLPEYFNRLIKVETFTTTFWGIIMVVISVVMKFK